MPTMASELRTFLIADVRGYTHFTQEHGDEAGARLAAKFASLARQGTTGQGGELVELRGDEALAVFRSARQALRAALDLQRLFAHASADDPDLPLAVGIGLDAGEAVPVEDGYRGGALNLAARLCSLAGPGQILVSDTVTSLARKMDDLTYAERGLAHLKGLADPVRVLEVLPTSGTPEAAPSFATSVGALGPASGAENPELPIGGFLGSLPSESLVAREDELARILTSVEAATEGQGQLVLLGGEPGIGKTRLAQEVMLNVRNRGFLIATGRCYEPEQSVPYYPFLDALSMAYAAAPRLIQAEVPGRWPHLSRLLPGHVPAPADQTTGADEQQRLFRETAAFLEALAEIRPIALLLDDLHWADGASLRLLFHLARYTRTSRIFLLATYRDVELGANRSLEAMLLDLSREELVNRIAVRRLDQDETAALLAASLGEAHVSTGLAQLIHRPTDGNPFFIQQVVRSMVERGEIYRQEGRWARKELTEIEVPETVRAVIFRRLSRLPSRAQDVLHEVSVLGQIFSFDDLEALGSAAGTSPQLEEEIEEALRAAGAGGLVRSLGDDMYTFDHALTQQALYADLSPRRRRRLHLTAGAALERLPTSKRERRAAEIARHFQQAGDAERALPWTLLAGNQAESVFAHAEAERHYRNALDLVRELPDDTPIRLIDEVRCLEKLGSVLRVQSRHAEALEMLERAAQLLRNTEDQDGEIAIAAQIGLTYAEQGATKEGVDRLRRFLRSLSSPEPSAGLAALYTAVARLHYFGGEYAESLEAATQSVELARGASAEAILAQAEVRRGAALYTLGRHEEALEAQAQAIEMATRVGDRESVCRALHTISLVHMCRGPLEEAKHYRHEMLRIAEEIDDPNQITFALAYLGLMEIYTGDWPEARGHLERAASMWPGLGATWYTTYTQAFLAYLSSLEGGWDRSSRLRQEATASGYHRDDPFIQALWAEQEIVEGYPREALRRLEAISYREDLTMAIGLAVRARAELVAGQDRSIAEARARNAVQLARKHGHRLHEADGQRILGMILAREARWTQARSAFIESERLSRQAGYRYGEALAQLEHGQMLIEEAAVGGESPPRQANALLYQALDAFQRLGARPDQERAEGALVEGV